MRASTLQGLGILISVACILQTAEAKSCKDDLDCPLKQCCTGNASSPGTCSPLFVKGKQVCKNCQSFPGRQLACPAGTSVCCFEGTCRRKATDCRCSSDGQCPLHTCCTGTYDKPGVCSPQAYVNGTYVCKDCQSRAGLDLSGGAPTSCPRDAATCCADGTCAKTAAECKCNDPFQCPFGFCCSGNYTHPGVCTTQRIVGGRQTCAQCGAARSNGAACPKEAAVCCGDGTCQKTIEGCTCSSSSDCDSTSCCTGTATKPGRCTRKAFVGGKQVCPDCALFGAAGQRCPSGLSTCCPDGACKASPQKCACTSNGGCLGSGCCTGNLTKPGHCAPAPYDANGTRVCQLCRADSAGSQACPGGRGVCCRDGTCRPKLSDCGCRKQADCPDGFCCSGDKAKPGKCVPQAFVNGKQVCKGCGTFGGRQLSCPRGAKYCCRRDQSCSADLAGCSCTNIYDCPAGSCCTGNSSQPGVCVASPFDRSGRQVCASCLELGDQNLACPAGASVCCQDGACRASLADCGCSINYDCPPGTCCTAKNGTRGHCSPSVFAGGKQVCPMCEPGAGGDLACPREARFCCPDGSCKKDASLCQCAASHDCPAKHCCSGFRHGKRGTCVAQPFANGTQVCPDCMHFGFQGLSCPAGASTCCADGTCKPSLQSCKCTSDAECDYGSCCTRKSPLLDSTASPFLLLLPSASLSFLQSVPGPCWPLFPPTPLLPHLTSHILHATSHLPPPRPLDPLDSPPLLTRLEYSAAS